MIIGETICKFRESKGLSQGGVERRTGLRRHYVSRVENGHTIPNIETLEKFASALEIPLYRFFYEGKERPVKLDLPSTKGSRRAWGAKGKELEYLREFAKALSRIDERDRRLLMGVAYRMAARAMRTR
jgi:transcriptional regulator with XRE-family HTH domain